MTPALDYVFLSYKRQKDLDESQQFYVRAVKFAFVLFSFGMGYVSKVFREQVTNNFAKWERPDAKRKEKIKKEKLLLPATKSAGEGAEEPKSEK